MFMFSRPLFLHHHPPANRPARLSATSVILAFCFLEEGAMVFPYMTHLLAAMLLGALIGAERQWRQRMAGLRTNATGAAVFILSAMSASPDSPGRIAAQIVSGIGFLGAGVIMRDGMNVRGLNTAATLWCSAGIGVLCGRQFWNATAATLIILCANILLREAAQRIHACRGR